MALRDVFAIFDIDVNAKPLIEGDKLVSSFAQKLEGLGKAFAGAFALDKLKDAVASTIEFGSHLRDTADRLGVSTDDLQAFEFAAGQAGVGADSAANALKFLNKALSEAANPGSETAKAFSELGVNAKALGEGSPVDAMVALGDAFKGLGSQGKRTELVMKLFGRAGVEMLPVLKDGSAGVRKLFEDFRDIGGAMSEDFVNSADDAGDALDALKVAGRNLVATAVLPILPALTSAAQWLARTAGALRHAVEQSNIFKGALTALASGGIATVVAGLAKISAAGNPFGGMLSGLMKFGPWIAGIALLALAVDDLVTFAQGGDSVIGDLFDAFGNPGDKEEAIKTLGELFDSLKEAATEAGPAVKEVLSASVTILKELRPVIPFIVEAFAGMLKVISATVIELSGLFAAMAQVPAALKSGDWTNVGNTLNRTTDRVIDIFTPKPQAAPGAGGAGEAFGPSLYQLTGDAGLMTKKEIQQQNSINVNVYPGGKEGEAGEVRKGINDAMNDQRNALQALQAGA